MVSTRRTVRFGFQLGSEHEHDPVGVAHRAEELGFDVVLLSDHVGPGISPLVMLAAMAQATSRIRLGTYVLNNDMRNPVQLAWEAVTLDRLSGGRFELGIGAGHAPQEYDHVGLQQDRPSVRKARLAESVEIMRPLFDGELVDFEGAHYQIRGAKLDRSVQTRLPIMVAGNGASLLGHAGAHADIIGLQGLGESPTSASERSTSSARSSPRYEHTSQAKGLQTQRPILRWPSVTAWCNRSFPP